MAVLPALLLLLLGSLFICDDVAAQYNAADALREAAVSFDGNLDCQNWNCSCTFRLERGCCCAVDDMSKLEYETYKRMKYLSLDIKILSLRVQRITDGINVAFKATMDSSHTGCFGPVNRNIPIPYTKISLNEGSGYNPSVGLFTAPYSGVYAFSFTVYSHVDENDRLYHKAQLMKNGNTLAGVWEENREDGEDSATQYVLEQMERGEQVYVELTEGRKICDRQNSNSFTGYLVFYN